MMAVALIALLLGFFAGYGVSGCGKDNVTSDTTTVSVKPPPAQTTTGIPAKPVPPKIVYKDRLVPDSSALYESAWLQNENAVLKDSLDSLMAQTDGLRARLAVLLAPHTANSKFDFNFASGGFLRGDAEQAYVPLKEQFGLKLTPTELNIPVITNTKHPAWWVKPALLLGGASTAYFIGEKNSTGALIAGGASSVLLFVEF